MANGDGVMKNNGAGKKNADGVKTNNGAGMKNSDGVKLNNGAGNGKKQDVIFIIEKAGIQPVPIGKKYNYWNEPVNSTKFELLTGKEGYRGYGWNPSIQPEITHEAIKAVLGSKLNKSGQLKALYVRTDLDVLIHIKPHARIPEDYERFAKLILDLLQKSCISGDLRHDKVLRIVQNPVTQYLPANSVKIGLTHCPGSETYEKRADIYRTVARISSEKPLVFVIGAMAQGYIDVDDYIDEYILIDKHPESATRSIKKICDAVLKK